jgi:hypothetical protein
MIAKLLPFICAGVLAVLLTLGLSPFRAPANDVRWLGDRPGLAFGPNSGAISSDALQMADPGQESGASVEIWLQPARIWDKSTFLAFCDPGKPFKLSFRQSQTDLKIRVAKDEFYVSRIFRKATPVFLTITAGADGTAVYVGGSLVRTVAGLRLSTADFTGRLVIGDSPGQADSWQGQLYGLAIYHRELKPAEIARNYVAWMQTGRPETSQAERNAALYLLRERYGAVVHNAAASGPDLFIPARYTVLGKIFLEPFWQEFNLSWSYCSAALKNVVGFVPLGFCFYAWFTTLRLRRAEIATVALGTALSLTIEVLQGWLPTRDSGTTDIFTNTLGTWIGVAAYRAIGPALTRALPLALVDDGDDLRS